MEKHKKLAGKIHGLHSDIDGVLEQVNEAPNMLCLWLKGI